MIVSGPFYNQYIKLPPADETPLELLNNPKFAEFFKGCRGAIDGTHIDSFVPDDAVSRYCNWKGGLSQSVLAACTFDMCFCFILPGWEGSASDSCIFNSAWEGSFAVPPGTYYLADAGFPTCEALLIPYKGVRYHLKEWGSVSQK